MGYTEEEVWKLTPRKWNALVAVHLDLLNKKYGGFSDNSPSVASRKAQPPTAYIDQINL